MSGGLAALLDDVAALAKMAAASIDDVGAAAGKASAKAAGVVVDDTAVTPRYVQGFAASRELPIIRKIAVGSMRNKLLFIVPAALLLSQFLPWALTPLLMLGGTYLCYEGAEKVLEVFLGHGGHESEAAPDGDAELLSAAADEGGEGAIAAEATGAGEDGAETDEGLELPAAMDSLEHENQMVSGAIRTDFILSAEIIVIALNEVADQPFVARALILAVVALVITLLVYGVVGLIVKMDDIGLALAQRESAGAQRFGALLVRAMPRLLAALSTIGIVAMLWVGGHILLVGADELGWHTLYGWVHHAEEWVHEATGALGGILGWLTNTTGSAVAGLVVGFVAVGVMHLVHRVRTPDRRTAPASH